MKLDKRTNAIILWIIAIGLLVSMIITFTPGTLFGGQQQEVEGAEVLLVNGEPIRELEVARLEQSPPFNAVQEGPLAEDLDLLMLDELINQEVLRQAAEDTPVSNAEVRERVNEFREQQGVAGAGNDRAYQNLIAGAGYTDETFRDLIREQLKQEKFLEGVAEGVTVSDEEVQTFFEANRDAYTSEPRITAREIVVEDRALANELYARALAGEDFAALAREFSAQRAEQGGALGAAEGSSEPQPVGRAALPSAVADAAFGLEGPGLTEPTQAGGVYHIVGVEDYTPPSPRPFEEVAEEVRGDAQEAKEAGVQERTLRELRQQAEITVPEGSPYTFENPPVARVGDYEILEAELNRNTYLNSQIQQLINPSFADLILDSVKPNVLEGLIDQELAYQGAQRLDAPFVGTRAAVAGSALGFVSRDAEATDDQIRTYYRQNRARFTVPATAVVTRVNFDDRASARNFREALLGSEATSSEAIATAAEAAGGAVQEVGAVNPGEQPEAIDSALFNFQGNTMRPLQGGRLEISDVLTVTTPPPAATGGAQTGGAGGAPQEQFVVLVATRIQERVRPLAEVRPLVRQAVLAERRSEAQRAWLGGLREEIEVENLLASQQQGAGNAQTGGAGVPAPAGGEDAQPTQETQGGQEAPASEAEGAPPAGEAVPDAPQESTPDEENEGQ